MQKLEVVEHPVPIICLDDKIFVGDVRNADSPEDVFSVILLPVQGELGTPDGHYRHFKGGEYKTVGFCFRYKTQELLYIYKSLYDNGEFPKGTLWGRPIKDFLGTKKFKDGTKVPRFTYIEE